MTSDSELRIALPDGLHLFVRLILRDPAVQARLGAEIEADAFVAVAVAVAGEHGMSLDAAVLASVLRPDLLGLGRFAAAPVEFDGWPPLGWLPAQVVQGDGEPEFDWLWFGERRLTGSFFEDDLRRAQALPINWLLRVRTGLDALVVGATAAETVPLAGLVFHMSRCGSTLLARMLGAPPQHLVASEPEPLDAVIKWALASDVPDTRKVAAVRAVVAALGRRRDPAWTQFFVKLDAWHMLSYPLLRDAFPAIPWLFLHRDPVEVLVSLANLPALLSVPGMLPAGMLGIADPLTMQQDEYGATVLVRIGTAALAAHADGGGMIVDYADLIPAALAVIPRHFAIDLSAAERAAMAAVSGVHSKDPSAKFAPDAAAKQSSADPRTRELAAGELAELRARLLNISVA